MKILLIDAYDSFVHIIYQYFLSQEVEVDVIRNDKIDFSNIDKENYSLIVLGPGPGHPKDSGYVSIIDKYKGKVPIFGICLGMQAIVLAFGGEIVKSNTIMHGKKSYITHTKDTIFRNSISPMEVARYHSLVAKQESFPSDELKITSTSNEDNNIMSVTHLELLVRGVQFHPESIITKGGENIFKNVIDWAAQ